MTPNQTRQHIVNLCELVHPDWTVTEPVNISHDMPDPTFAFEIHCGDHHLYTINQIMDDTYGLMFDLYPPGADDESDPTPLFSTVHLSFLLHYLSR